MKVLHLYANHKWTGPADLALQLAQRLHASGESAKSGLQLEFAMAGFVHAGMEHAMRARAAELGLPVREGLQLRRHFHLPSLLADAATLAQWITRDGIRLLHCHQSGDHLLAAMARSLSKPIPIVRSYWEAKVSLAWPRQAQAFAATASVLTPFPELVEPLADRYSLARSRVLIQEPVLEIPDTVGSEERARARSDLLGELSLGKETRLCGITARIQARRRWDLLWDLVQEMSREDPHFHLVVLGRPDEGVFEEICERPLRERGASERVHFLGYRRGEAYRQALLALEVFFFLVPGSDPTCRALREAMALGLPAVTSDLGHLRSIVEEGVTGLCRPARVDELAPALRQLLGRPEQARRMGEAAARRARERWAGEAQVAQTLALYEALLGDAP